MSKIKPILFNTEMIRGLLNGTKTVTRRVVKPQPNMFSLRDGIKAPYRPGDILYVRETWAPSTGGIVYKASLPYEMPKWYPSIHMPREAARIFLRVTDVRVERLQDITEDGSMAEGIQCRKASWARIEFADLWNSTIKPDDILRYSWEANPWVWVIEFERCEKPEGD